MPRDLEIFFLYQQSGRFPDLQIITHGLVFPAHSDEIVQAFHLFPFYLLSACSHELFHSDSSTGCLFDCYGRYFSITEIIMQ